MPRKRLGPDVSQSETEADQVVLDRFAVLVQEVKDREDLAELLP